MQHIPQPHTHAYGAAVSQRCSSALHAFAAIWQTNDPMQHWCRAPHLDMGVPHAALVSGSTPRHGCTPCRTGVGPSPRHGRTPRKHRAGRAPVVRPHLCAPNRRQADHTPH
eukprot:361808-Chlamydomonas_euryale.AAC.8